MMWNREEGRKIPAGKLWIATPNSSGLGHLERQWTANDGTCFSHQFFGSAKTDQGSRRRLRARVQYILENFAEDMRVHGQNRVLLDEMPEDEEIGVCSRYILRSDYIEEVKNPMKKSHGRELSGTSNPMIISELFKEQCKPWQGLVDKVREQVLHATDEVTNAIVTHVAAEDTVPGILSILRNARTNSIRDLDAKFETLLEPHLNGHPVTYDHYMTDNVQKAQERRRTQELEKAFRDLVGAENFKKGKKVALYPHDMFTKLKRRTEVGMQLYQTKPLWVSSRVACPFPGKNRREQMGRSALGLLVLYRNGTFGYSHPRADILSSRGAVFIRVNLSRPVHVKAGQYINLWICMPSQRFRSLFESHPFVVVSWSDRAVYELDLLIEPRSGFTRDLLRVSKTKVEPYRALFSGPHGNSIPLGNYEVVLMIASGYGIAAQLPYLKQLIHGYNSRKARSRRVHLVWKLKTLGGCRKNRQREET
ncbi:hypothetical protein MY3957_006154 [Beauveria namnaoensis]